MRSWSGGSLTCLARGRRRACRTPDVRQRRLMRDWQLSERPGLLGDDRQQRVGCRPPVFEFLTRKPSSTLMMPVS